MPVDHEQPSPSHPERPPAIFSVEADADMISRVEALGRFAAAKPMFQTPSDESNASFKKQIKTRTSGDTEYEMINGEPGTLVLSRIADYGNDREVIMLTRASDAEPMIVTWSASKRAKSRIGSVYSAEELIEEGDRTWWDLLESRQSDDPLEDLAGIGMSLEDELESIKLELAINRDSADINKFYKPKNNTAEMGSGVNELEFAILNEEAHLDFRKRAHKRAQQFTLERADKILSEFEETYMEHSRKRHVRLGKKITDLVRRKNRPI